MKINELLTERYINILKSEDKEQYAERVFQLIKQSYEPIGGHKASEFVSPQAMIDGIPMWKLIRRNNEIVAGAMYKDNNGRKRAAVFTDGSAIGKSSLADLMANDFERAYFEVSGPSLRFMVKLLGDSFVKQYAKTPEQAGALLSKDTESAQDSAEASQYPSLAEFFYTRLISGKPITKILLGTSGNKIILPGSKIIT